MFNPTLETEYDVINYDAGVSDEILGQECASCFRLLTWNFYDKDSSYKNGYKPQCSWCTSQPKLSMKEHTSRLREMNYNSAGTARQRHPDQEFFYEDRPGRSMDCSLFLQKLLHVYPALFVTQGGIVTDLALYATSPVAKPGWSDRDFKYIGYVTLGVLPEYSRYEFDQRDILQRCTQIGWRSVLLRFVENNILTEDQCLKEFGPPSGGVNSLWYKKLHNHRNAKKIA